MNVTIAFHSASTTDGQQTLAVQRPGQVAAVPLRAAGTAGNNVRRQRSGRQERHDHQHREHEAQKSFSHTVSSIHFSHDFAYFAAHAASRIYNNTAKFIPILLIPFHKHKCKGISTIDTFCDIITTNFICRVKLSLPQSQKLHLAQTQSMRMTPLQNKIRRNRKAAPSDQL